MRVLIKPFHGRAFCVLTKSMIAASAPSRWVYLTGGISGRRKRRHIRSRIGVCLAVVLLTCHSSQGTMRSWSRGTGLRPFSVRQGFTAAMRQMRWAKTGPRGCETGSKFSSRQETLQHSPKKVSKNRNVREKTSVTVNNLYPLLAQEWPF